MGDRGAMTDTLAAGREAMRAHAWQQAFDSFTTADTAAPLTPEDLAQMAQAAWWSGRPDDAVELWERLYTVQSSAGEKTAAAYAAIRLAEMAMRRNVLPVAAGWLARAERLLESEPESAVHAWLHFIHSATALFGSRDWDAAIEHADAALELGRRHGDTNVQSIALTFKGSALVRKGRWEEGLALFDEATASAVSGELDPKTACDVYCNTIATCRELADYARAAQWTEQADRFMARNDINGYRGACRLHRAELKRLHGSWDEAEQEVLDACKELEDFRLLDITGEAYYELGELRLNMGDIDRAEEAFHRAYGFGKTPQPGLALVQLARGRLDEAGESITRALAPSDEHDGSDQLERARMLPAHVEIAIAGGDLETARSALAELDDIAGRFASPSLSAGALTARGRLELAEARLDAAVRTFDRAWRSWQEIDLPFESARARMLLGVARIEAGDRSTGVLDVKAARSVFERLGARRDLAQADQVLGGETAPATVRVTRTFMFTDIVTSTDLLELIGDQAWEELLRWHDRTLRETFIRHGGQEVRKLGDGFFVSFTQAGPALDCAVAVQQRLASHRREHGFAPWVRIGVHTTEASHEDDDYSGLGVHLAARVGGAADREEILVSEAARTAAGPGDHNFTNNRRVTVKGITEPVEVHTLEWR